MSKQYYVYILTNKTHSVLYVGITNDLVRRVWQHKEKLVQGFTSTYTIHLLVWYEIHQEVLEALNREKQLKGGPRLNKINLIESQNPHWKDLYYEIIE